MSRARAPGLRVLIKGAGEHASASAHRLFRCGFQVAMTELPRPTAVRRTVAFCSAVFEGRIEIEGVPGVRHDLERAAELASFDWSHIPVVVDPECALRGIWKPQVIVDGRILKRNLDNRITDAPLVIGLGPGLEAGRDVHAVVETNRGHHLGRIITEGLAACDTGRPGDIGGYTRERLLLSPATGRFETGRAIGDPLAAGEVVGQVGGLPVRAAIAGVLRGVVFPGLEVNAGQKLGDVDPRGDRSFCFSLSDKARTISGSVLEIVVRHAAGAPPLDA